MGKEALFLHRYSNYPDGPRDDIALIDNLHSSLKQAIALTYLIVAADGSDEVPDGTIPRAAHGVIGTIEDALVILNEWYETEKLEKEPYKPSIDYMIQTHNTIEAFIKDWREMMEHLRAIDREVAKGAELEAMAGEKIAKRIKAKKKKRKS